MNRPLLMALALVVALTAPSQALAASTPRSLWISVRLGDAHGVPPGTTTGIVEWFSGGVLLFNETNAFLVIDGLTNIAHIAVDGNGNPATFQAIYEGPTTSILTAPDLTVRVSVLDHRGSLLVIAEQRYTPAASALWSKHSEDTVALQAQIDALRHELAELRGALGLAR